MLSMSTVNPLVAPTAAMASTGAKCPNTIRSAAWNINPITLDAISGREKKMILLKSGPWHISIWYFLELLTGESPELMDMDATYYSSISEYCNIHLEIFALNLYGKRRRVKNS